MTSIVFSDQHPPKKYTFKPDLYYMIGNLLFPSGMLDQSYVVLECCTAAHGYVHSDRMRTTAVRVSTVIVYQLGLYNRMSTKMHVT